MIEWMLDYVKNLLVILGVCVEFGGKFLINYIIFDVYGVLEFIVVFVLLKEILRNEENFVFVIIEIFGLF